MDYSADQSTAHCRNIYDAQECYNEQIVAEKQQKIIAET